MVRCESFLFVLVVVEGVVAGASKGEQQRWEMEAPLPVGWTRVRVLCL